MDPVSAIAGAAGSLVSNIFNVNEQKKMNQKQIDLANQQMNFQERMSSTAHQREKKDFELAGINPMAGFGGASTPSGASPSLQAPQISMPDMMAYGVSLKQLELAERELDLKGDMVAADISKKLSETELTKAKKILAQKGMIRAELEGEGSKFLKDAINFLRKSAFRPFESQRGSGAGGSYGETFLKTP